MANWIAAAALGPLLNGIVIGVALAAAVWLLFHLLPRTNATTRYAVWSATLVAIAFLPVLMAAAPEFLAVCRGLIQAYEFGLKNGGSVRWEDMDDVHRMALAAVEGLGEKSG